MQCALCRAKPQYRDRQTGQYLCLKHARLEVVVPGRRPSVPTLAIRPATASDYTRIEELSGYFWDETCVDCFDRQYDVLACPAFLACEGDEVVGLASYAVEEAWDAIVLVIFNLLPDFQGRGGGRSLLDAVHGEAVQRGLAQLLVVTSNDDLPALALYQRYGFRITEVIPGRIAQHHGAEFPGFAGIPVRDEIRLTYKVRSE
ncbi:MAG TPA: GNAT family N-acetyltransferase [Anaerolineae bacterium]|nr:GNAT family N-acetyltransferase [Anaerolineae bacterium]